MKKYIKINDSPGIRGYVEDVEFTYSGSSNLISEFTLGKIQSTELINNPTFTSRWLYPFALLLEYYPEYSNKVLSLNSDFKVRPFLKKINPKWVSNNQIIYPYSEKYLQTIYAHFRSKNTDIRDISKKLNYKKNSFLNKKLNKSLDILYNEELFRPHSQNYNKVNRTYYNRNDFFIYLKWYDKPTRQVLVYLIKNNLIEKQWNTEIDKLPETHYFFKTGMLYGFNENYEVVNKSFDLLKKSYYEKILFEPSEINNTLYNEPILMFIVDLNREDFLQKTWLGRWHYYWNKEEFCTDDNSRYHTLTHYRNHIEKYLNDRFFNTN